MLNIEGCALLNLVYIIFILNLFVSNNKLLPATSSCLCLDFCWNLKLESRTTTFIYSF